jgi:hypothetical protein
VEAVLHPDHYKTGWTVTNALMHTLNLEPHAICPVWSYTLRPVYPPVPEPQRGKLFLDAG